MIIIEKLDIEVISVFLDVYRFDFYVSFYVSFL